MNISMRRVGVAVALFAAGDGLPMMTASEASRAEPRLTEQPEPREKHSWPQRKTLKRGEVVVEYSPGQEVLADAVADEALRLSHEFEALVAAPSPPPQPLSAADARQRRDVFLAEIAKELGLSAPTTLQTRCYDTMLDYYEMMAGLYAAMGESVIYFGNQRSLAIWDRQEVVSRLEAGETIPGMRWDPVKQEGEFSLNFNFESKPTEEEKQRKEQAEKNRLNHAFNYVVKDGVAHIAATFNLRKEDFGSKSAYVAPANKYAHLRENVREDIRGKAGPVIPLVIKADGPATVETLLEQQRNFARWARDTGLYRDYRDGPLALILLHETIEVGIVERYIGSADRRWLCDGAANFLAWKIAQRHAGNDFARQTYDLDSQLRQHSGRQREIRLREWTAVEHEKDDPEIKALSESHYPFATRALAMMVTKHGEDFPAKLFAEIGKTPRKNVRHKTIKSAYRTLTGGNLDELLTAAEQSPISQAPSS